MAKRDTPDANGHTNRDRALLSRAVLKAVASGKVPAAHQAGALRVAKEVLKRQG